MKELIKKYEKDYDPKKLLGFLKTKAKTLGIQTVYSALLLYNALLWGEAPTWAKMIVIGTLGYLLSPIDSIPDITPYIGFTDDLGVLAMGLVLIATYINDGIKARAKKQLKKWFKSVDDSELETIDSKF